MARSVLRFAKAMMATFNSGYRPEQHYMRGPGPAFYKRFGGDMQVGG